MLECSRQVNRQLLLTKEPVLYMSPHNFNTSRKHFLKYYGIDINFLLKENEYTFLFNTTKYPIIYSFQFKHKPFVKTK